MLTSELFGMPVFQMLRPIINFAHSTGETRKIESEEDVL